MRALVPAEESEDAALADRAQLRLHEEIQRLGDAEGRRPHILNARDAMLESHHEFGADILRILPSLSFSGNEANPLFHNRGDGTFEPIGEVSGAGRREDARAFVAADFDGDGDLDLAVHNAFRQPLFILRNDAGAPKPSIIVRLRGEKSNRFGIGSRVVVKADGRTQMQELTCGEGFTSCGPAELHFGLADAEKVDSLVVKWPTGKTQEFKDLPARRCITITEENATPVLEEFSKPPELKAPPPPIRTIRPGDRWPSIDLGGKRTIVALFSVGCQQCRQEIALRDDHAQRTKDALRWMSLDEDDDAVKKFQTESGEGFEFSMVPPKDRPLVAGAGGSRLPLVYVVGADGVVESKFLGEGALDGALER